MQIQDIFKRLGCDKDVNVKHIVLSLLYLKPVAQIDQDSRGCLQYDRVDIYDCNIDFSPNNDLTNCRQKCNCMEAYCCRICWIWKTSIL